MADSIKGQGAEKREYANDWAARVRNLIKEEMRRQDLSYSGLAQRLREQGIADYNTRALQGKIGRGSFSAAFLIQILCGLGCDRLDLSELSLLRQELDTTQDPGNPE
jgi:hypothetical protein